VAKFRYLGITVTDENYVREEIKGRVNSGKACYHFVRSLLSSRHLSANIKIKIYKTVILPIVLYWCETLSVTLREAHRFGVSENRVLRRIFGPNREKVVRGWRRLHNEELHNLYASPNINGAIKSRMMRCAGHVVRVRGMRNAYKIVVVKLECWNHSEDVG
jgi:hypothetical protein